MQFNFISLGALAYLISSVAAGGIYLGGKRADLPDDCKRAVSALPSVVLQTTATDPQPTELGTGSGGVGNKNGTTPMMPPSAAATSGTTNSSKSGAGVVGIKWTMGTLAAAGAVALAI